MTVTTVHAVPSKVHAVATAVLCHMRPTNIVVGQEESGCVVLNGVGLTVMRSMNMMNGRGNK